MMKSFCFEKSLQLTISFSITNIGFTELTDNLNYNFDLSSKYLKFISIKIIKGDKKSKLNFPTKIYYDESELQRLNLTLPSFNPKETKVYEKNSELISDEVTISDIKQMTRDILEFNMIVHQKDLVLIEDILKLNKKDKNMDMEEFKEFDFFFDIVNFNITKDNFKHFNVDKYNEPEKKFEIKARLPSPKVAWIIIGVVIFMLLVLLICKVLLSRIQKTLFLDEEDEEINDYRVNTQSNIQTIYDDFVNGYRRERSDGNNRNENSGNVIGRTRGTLVIGNDARDGFENVELLEY